MTERSQNPQPGSKAEELFAGWIAGRPSDEPREFEALCSAHADLAGELRRLHGEWQRMESLLKRAGLGVAPGAGESLARKLAEKYGSGVDPHVSLHEEEEKSGGPPTSQLLERLREHALKSTRYRLHGEIARGGMGAILKVWDEDLRRSLAMKVILGKAESYSEGKTPPVDKRVLARFLEEAQVTGQLDHPGIVPVHELGLDAEGRVYFTMKLVKGRDLKQIFELAFEEQEGWNETRALGVILKVCEAMAYAHRKGVIHRDLKPANVMVGGFGEVFVMDWGLARVLGQKDTHDLRLQPLAATSSLATERREERADAPDSPLFTMDGDVVGTPCYMPPEQARGEIEKLSPRSDVYSIGAMLYHLLARQMPYCPPDVRVTNRTVLGMVLHGPPASIESLRKGVPAELVAISEKAMAREANERYADTQALAEDLRAYLEGRVVRAYETGAWAEARKWVHRNKPLAAALASAAALLVGGLTTSLVFKARADERERDAREKAAALELANTDLATSKNTAEANLKSAEEQAYVANIAAADASLRSNEIGEAKRRLDACADRLRGWEWRYLHLASDTSVGALRGHNGGSIALSPDGTRLVSVGRDKARIVSESEDKTVHVLNATSGEILLVLRGHEEFVESVAFNSDCTRIVSGSQDGTVRVWNATGGESLLVLRGHDGRVNSVAFSPDGTRIVSGTSGKTVHVWNTVSGEMLVLRGHNDQVTSVAFSPDGWRIVSGSWDKTVRVWDISGEQLCVLRRHDGGVNSVAFSADGSRIVSGSSDKTVRVWNTISCENMLVLRGHDGRVNSVAFSPDGSRIVSGSSDKTVRVWNASNAGNPRVLRGHESGVDSVAFSSDGGRIAASSDGSVRIWNATAENPLILATDPLASCVGFSPDGTRIVSGSWDKTVRVWNATSGENLLVLRGLERRINSVAFSPDGTRIVSGSDDKAVHVWNASSGEQLLVLRGHDDGVHSVAFSPDGTRIVSGSWDQTVRVWNTTSGEELLVLRGHDGGVNSVAFSSDGTRIVSGSWDQTVRLWNTTSGEELLVLRGHDGGVNSVAFSRDGPRIVSGSSDQTVRVWNTPSGEELFVLRGHDETVNSVAFNPDGTRIVSGSWDKTVRVWNAISGENLLVLRGHDSEVRSVAFSPDGTRIVSCSWDKTICVWESSAEMISDLARQTAVAATHVVGSLFDRLGLTENVVHSLQSDESLPKDVQAAAMRIASWQEGDPRQLNNLSWSVAKLPHEERQAYANAVCLAEAACRLEPENDSYLSTLGVALYRLGEYEKAFDTLAVSDKLCKGHQPTAIAFLAMANHRLGRIEAARAVLARLRKLMRDAGFLGDEDAESFLSEAEALIGY